MSIEDNEDVWIRFDLDVDCRSCGSCVAGGFLGARGISECYCTR